MSLFASRLLQLRTIHSHPIGIVGRHYYYYEGTADSDLESVKVFRVGLGHILEDPFPNVLEPPVPLNTKFPKSYVRGLTGSAESRCGQFLWSIHFTKQHRLKILKIELNSFTVDRVYACMENGMHYHDKRDRGCLPRRVNFHFSLTPDGPGLPDLLVLPLSFYTHHEYLKEENPIRADDEGDEEELGMMGMMGHVTETRIFKIHFDEVGKGRRLPPCLKPPECGKTTFLVLMGQWGPSVFLAVVPTMGSGYIRAQSSPSGSFKIHRIPIVAYEFRSLA